MNSFLSCRLALLILSLAILTPGARALAADKNTTPIASADYTPPAKDAKVRNFYEVLEDLVSDFEFDLKNGDVTGLRDVSIRNIAVSENVPPSFKNHLELAITERIMKNTKVKVIQCLPCKARRTTVNGDQVVITSAETNPQELSRIAKISGIANFMDVAFSYQPSGMVLSMHISDPETGGIHWSRSYNSETSRASAFRRGVDYSQIDDARKATEYAATIQYRAILYYMFEKNVSDTSGCLGVGFRMMERYDNRRKEVGFELDYFKDAATLVGTQTLAAGTVNLWSGFNLTLLFMHAWNLIGAEENYNNVRGSAFVGLGGTYASGFLGGLVRGGYEWRLAKHWAVSANVGYRPSASAFIGSTSAGSVSGLEFGIGINGFF